MKLRYSFIALTLSIVILMSSVSVPANALEVSENTGNASVSEMDEYLRNAGYSDDFINEMDLSLKREYFEGQYKFESSTYTYGIFTEGYKIEYTLSDDGDVIIDEDNLAEYQRLISDQTSVEHILVEKAEAEGAEDTKAYNISSGNADNSISIQSLSNWRSSMTCSHISYSNGVTKKKLTYNWKWSYSPTWTLTDKMAIAWSGNFTAEPDTIKWTYNRQITFTGAINVKQTIPTSGSGYDDYNPNSGVAKGFNIKGPSAGTSVSWHAGSLSLTITKRTSDNSRESAVGRYYHTRINPSLSLGFSASGPSITVTSGWNYDVSSDSAVAFWATS